MIILILGTDLLRQLVENKGDWEEALFAPRHNIPLQKIIIH